MASELPINAEVPAQEPIAAQPEPARESSGVKRPPDPPQSPPARHRATPAAPLAIAALTTLALGLIAAAVLGGRGPRESTTGVATQQPAAPAGTLGFPAPATNNTTRIGGADPAARAAAVALAVYPSTDAAQRPGAVTLVGASDWRSAIAAAVLMAPPVGAPVLISEANDLPEPTSKALDALDPRGGSATEGLQAFAIGRVAVPDGLRAKRIGATGAAGAVAIARLRDRLSGAPPKHVVVAPAQRPAFAMPAAAWAARSGDPILFTAGRRLSAPTAKALTELKRTPVYVLGPPSVVSHRVVREIAATGATVRRVSGKDPVENAVALARYSDGDFGWNLNDPGHGFVIARASSPLDAAGAAALSASGTWGALLLTDRADTLPAALRGYLLDVKPGYTTDPTRAFYNHVWVIGDQEAIDVRQQAQINRLAELTQIGGES